MSPRSLLDSFAKCALSLALTCPVLLPGLVQAASSIKYRLTHSVPLGAPNAWDYVLYEPLFHRVFVAHRSHLTVVDERTGHVVGEVGPIGGGAHGIAFDTKAGLGITDDGRSGQAVIFNLESLSIVKRLKIHSGADAVAFDPVSGHAFIIEGESGDIAVIDPAHEKVIAFIQIGGDLEYAVSSDDGKLYVNGVYHRQIIRIDTATNRIDAVWPIPQCRDPHGLAIDTKTHRLFSSCENRRLVVISSKDGTPVATVPIGSGSDAVRFDARRRLILSSNGRDGTLSIIREVNAETFLPLTKVTTAFSGRTMGLDPATGRVFLAAAETISPYIWREFIASAEGGHPPKSSPLRPDSLMLLFFDPSE
jgi:DNA-binding beta-propeller fold protein YncE